MNTIEVGKCVAHKDGRKGEVVELKDSRARVLWQFGPDGKPLIKGAFAMSSRPKRTWVKLQDINLISRSILQQT